MKQSLYFQDPKYRLRPGRDYVRDPSLVLDLPLYKLDGASFMSKDALGHRATATGASWSLRGRRFDGSDDKIIVPDHPSLDLTEPLTIEVWADFPEQINRCFVSKPHVTSARYANYVLMLTGTSRLQAGFGDGVEYRIKSATELLTAGAYHLAGVIISAADIRLYIDGVEKPGTYSGPATTLTKLPGDLSIGTWASSYLEGVLGEVRIYNRALTPIEIERNYLATKQRYR